MNSSIRTVFVALPLLTFGSSALAQQDAARVDEMVSSVLDTTAGIASTIQKGVQIPVREFHGIMNGIKAGIDVLVGRRNHTPRYRGDDGL